MSWKDKILNPEATTSSTFGGSTVNSILDYFSAIDLTVGGTLPAENADISTETVFANNTLKLWDSNKTHKVTLQTQDYTENHTITLPSESALPTSDEFMTKAAVQVVTGKTMNFTTDNTAQNIPKSALPSVITYEDEDNAMGQHYMDFTQVSNQPPNPSSTTRRLFVNTDGKLSVITNTGLIFDLEAGGAGSSTGGISAGGTATFNGTGSQTVFNIAHGLSPTPDFVNIEANSVDALGSKVITVDATNIVVTYQTAPVSGTSNVSFLWAAGYTSEAQASFTPSSITTLSNKTIAVDNNTIKHSTTNAAGDILKGNGTSFQRLARGTANQVLAVNGAGTDIEWSTSAAGVTGSSTTTFTNKTIGVDNNIINHSVTNATGDILVYQTDRYNRLARGTANQVLTVNTAGTDIEWSSASGVTASSTTTFTNKTIGDHLTYNLQGTPPVNPGDADDSLIYTKAIDANNNGLFVKIKKNTGTVEVQIA